MLPNCQQQRQEPTSPKGCPLRQPRLAPPCPNPLSRGTALHKLGLPEIAAGEGQLPMQITGVFLWSWCSKKRCRDQTRGGLQGWWSFMVMLACHLRSHT